MSREKPYTPITDSRSKHFIIPIFIMCFLIIGIIGKAVWADERLANQDPSALANSTKADSATLPKEAVSPDEAHLDVFDDNRFPPATACQTCHEDHYREWSVSPHAYAQLSPVFNAYAGTVLKLSNGTIGDFCLRCHTPPGAVLGEPLFVSNLERRPITREGVTCVVCHRIDKAFGKENGRFSLHEGDIFEPVFGPTGNEELERVIESPDYQIVTDPGKKGRAIHREARMFTSISQPGFCGKCHDITAPRGLRFEVGFSEYKASPAAQQGITCQDCHMSKEPGKAVGYAKAPAARIGDVETQPRKRTNHMFVGVDHSVIHPGLFPHNPEAMDLATMQEWLTFDHKAGWGTDEFEDVVSEDIQFPERWDSVDDRYMAREVLDAQIELLTEYEQFRKGLLREGYRLGQIEIDEASENLLRLKVEVLNGTNGHGVPTSFDADRLVFLQVTVTDRENTKVFQSGDLDPNGDLRDMHSLYVHNGELPLDPYLFSLQSKFILRNLRGSESETILAVNASIDPLPFVRPNSMSSILLGRPIETRKHKQNIEIGGSRWASYEVTGSALSHKGPYTANIKLIAGMLPNNLLNAIKDVGFDYGMSARDIGDEVVAGFVTLWERTLTIEIPKSQGE